jgi:hypothetical protein
MAAQHRHGADAQERTAHAWRCYDFRCQAWVAPFSGPHAGFVRGASAEAEPGRDDGCSGGSPGVGDPLTGLRRAPASVEARGSSPRLFTRPRVTPPRGGVSSAARGPPCGGRRGVGSGLGLRGDRDPRGHRPQASCPLTGHGHRDHVGVVAACEERASACPSPDRGLPPEVLDDVGWVVQAPWPVAADRGGRAAGPGAVAHGATGHWRPRQAGSASPTGGRRQGFTWAGRACARGWRRAGGSVTARPSAWKTSCGAGVAPAHVGAPPPRGRPPGGRARPPEILPPQEGVETTRGSLAVPKGLFAGLVRRRWSRSHGRVPRVPREVPSAPCSCAREATALAS